MIKMTVENDFPTCQIWKVMRSTSKQNFRKTPQGGPRPRGGRERVCAAAQAQPGGTNESHARCGGAVSQTIQRGKGPATAGKFLGISPLAAWSIESQPDGRSWKMPPGCTVFVFPFCCSSSLLMTSHDTLPSTLSVL